MTLLTHRGQGPAFPYASRFRTPDASLVLVLLLRSWLPVAWPAVHSLRRFGAGFIRRGCPIHAARTT